MLAENHRINLVLDLTTKSTSLYFPLCFVNAVVACDIVSVEKS